MGSGTKSSSGLLPLVAVVAIGAVAVFGGARALHTLESAVNSTESGNGDYAMAAGAETLVEHCGTEQILSQRRCGDVKIVVLNAEKMPYITRNIRLAWDEGMAFVLTRNSALQDANRSKACGNFAYSYASSHGSCDEYPFATTAEGGDGARTEEVYIGEQRCQGGTVSRGYSMAGIANGDKFLVVISHPDKIASRPWQDQTEPVESC